MTNEIILYNSPKAASIETVAGWVSIDGRFFGDNEHAARYWGSTHKACKNNPDHPPYVKNYYCEPCADIKRLEKFNAMPVVEWDGKTLLNLLDTETYFDNQDQIDEFCFEYKVDPSELALVLCEPNSMREVEYDQWSEILHEDVDLPSEIETALDLLNDAIREHGKAVSWSPGSKRVRFNSEVNND